MVSNEEREGVNENIGGGGIKIYRPIYKIYKQEGYTMKNIANIFV